MHMSTTRDLSKFGARELRLAQDLLTAYLEKDDSCLGDTVAIEFNFNSGLVFMVDSEYNVAVLHDTGNLVDFINCPECGFEAPAPEFEEGSELACCGQYHKERSLSKEEQSVLDKVVTQSTYSVQRCPDPTCTSGHLEPLNATHSCTSCAQFFNLGVK